MKPDSCGGISFFLFLSLISIGHAATSTRTIPTGVTSLAVPYLIGSNTVIEVLPTAPEGTQLYKIARSPSSARWTVNQFQSGAWLRPNETLLPGEGAYIRNPGASFDLTLTGSIPPMPFFQTPPHGGASLLGMPHLPNLSFTPNEGDAIWIWGLNGYFDIGGYYEYYEGLGWIGDFGFYDSPPVGITDGVMYLRQPLPFTPPGAEPASAIYFNNRIPAASLNSPVTTTLGCVGSNLIAQLVVGPPGNSPTNEIDPFANILDSGYVDPQLDLVRDLPYGGGTLSVEVRVWDRRAGNYQNAQAASAMWGHGPQFQVQVPPLFHPPVNITQFVPLIGPLTPFPVTQAPTNTVAFVGTAAQLSVALITPTLFTYQWQCEDTNTSTWFNLAATNATLAWPAVSTTNAGRYRVVVTRDCTNQILGPVTLSVGSALISKAAVRGPGGVLTFQVSGLAGLNYRLEHSTNLTQWNPGPLYPNAPAQWTLPVTNTGPGQTFYRLVTEP